MTPPLQLTSRHTQACTHTHTHTYVGAFKGFLGREMIPVEKRHISFNSVSLNCTSKVTHTHSYSLLKQPFIHTHTQQRRAGGSVKRHGQMENVCVCVCVMVCKRFQDVRLVACSLSAQCDPTGRKLESLFLSWACVCVCVCESDVWNGMLVYCTVYIVYYFSSMWNSVQYETNFQIVLYYMFSLHCKCNSWIK